LRATQYLLANAIICMRIGQGLPGVQALETDPLLLSAIMWQAGSLNLGEEPGQLGLDRPHFDKSFEKAIATDSTCDDLLLDTLVSVSKTRAEKQVAGALETGELNRLHGVGYCAGGWHFIEYSW